MSNTQQHAGWYQRLFARLLAGSSEHIDSRIAPQKRALFADLHGDVVEIGPGTGANLAYYAPDVRWIGIEPNPYMHPYLRREAERLGHPEWVVRTGSAEKLDLPDASVDALVSTLVLCSVADQRATLAEIRRVLRPGGRFLFIEHVAAPRGTWQRRWQDLIQPLWTPLVDGCHPNRETGSSLLAAGFAQVEMQPFTIDAPIVAPHIVGMAVK